MFSRIFDCFFADVVVYDCTVVFILRHVLRCHFAASILGFLQTAAAAVKTAFSYQGHQSAVQPGFWAAVLLDSKLGALSHGGRSQGRSSRLNITFLGGQTAMKAEWLSMRVPKTGEAKGQCERKIVGAEVNIRC